MQSSPDKNRESEGMGSPEAPSVPRNKKHGYQPVLMILILATAVLICYANTLQNKFVFDDYDIFVNHKYIESFRYLPKVLGIDGGRGYYRPVRFVSYMLDYSLYGLNPAGFHLSNLIYHLIAAILVYLIALRFAATPYIALCAALLFAVHPIQTESVAYLAGRRDLLFSLFYLMGFYFFLKYDETGRRGFAAGLITAFGLSLLSKEMAVTLPAVGFCYFVVKRLSLPAGPRQIFNAIIDTLSAHKIVYTVLFVIAVFYAVDIAFFHNPSKISAYYGGGVLTNAMTVLAVIGHYIKLLVLPIELNADYSYNAFPAVTSLTDLRFLTGLITIALVIAGLIKSVSYDKWILFGGLWFFITLLPVCHIIPHHELMAEHYLYLPIFGFSLAVILLLHHFLSRGSERWIFYGLVTLLVALSAARTIDRNRDWRDNLTLWRQTAQTAPNSARTQNNYGKALMQNGDFEPAIRALERATQIQANYAEAFSNLGVLYGVTGREREAMRYFKRALEIQPRFPEVYFNIGIQKSRQKRFREAETAYKEAIRLRPWFASAHFSLGKLYARTGDTQRAIHHFTRVIRINSRKPIAEEARLEIDKLEKN